MTTRTLETGISYRHFLLAHKKILVVVCSLIISSLSFSTPVWGAGNGRTTKTKTSSVDSSATPSPTSAWVLPTQKNKNPILIQAGRSLPIKFELVVNGAKLQSADNVQLSVKTLNSCSIGAAPAGNPSVIVSPVPVPTVSVTASSSSEDSRDLRVQNSTFIYVWKVPKNQASGCYQLEAKKVGVTVVSPIIKVQGTK